MLSTKGIARPAIGIIGTLVILETTKIFKPSGGVIKPTPSAVTIVIQKCTSFIPITSVASGKRIGARITMFGVVSRKQPAIIKMPIITKVRSTGFTVIEVMNATKA